ncbi:MAG: hypothetical protein H8E72_02830 [Candidatus Marinimicrobia bacterium]|nr:hypothetical protein [Candidatus Neomarinimicrobiota bacterium]
MARRRKTKSIILNKARTRIASIQAIDMNLDLGNDKSVANYREALTQAEKALSEYNGQLSIVDDLLNNFQAKEQIVNTLSTEMLSGIKAIYGWNSSEYEQAGGTRISERKRRKLKPRVIDEVDIEENNNDDTEETQFKE